MFGALDHRVWGLGIGVISLSADFPATEADFRRSSKASALDKYDTRNTNKWFTGRKKQLSILTPDSTVLFHFL